MQLELGVLESFSKRTRMSLIAKTAKSCTWRIKYFCCNYKLVEQNGRVMGML